MKHSSALHSQCNIHSPKINPPSQNKRAQNLFPSLNLSSSLLLQFLLVCSQQHCLICVVAVSWKHLSCQSFLGSSWWVHVREVHCTKELIIKVMITFKIISSVKPGVHRSACSLHSDPYLSKEGWQQWWLPCIINREYDFKYFV